MARPRRPARSPYFREAFATWRGDSCDRQREPKRSSRPGHCHAREFPPAQQFPLGANQITVVYSGDANYAGTSDGPLSFTVIPAPDFTFTTSPGNPGTVQILAPGQSSSPLTLVVTAQNGYTGTVDFAPLSCSILPAGSQSTCSFQLRFRCRGDRQHPSYDQHRPHHCRACYCQRSIPPNLNLWLGRQQPPALTLIFVIAFPVKRRSWVSRSVSLPWPCWR